jgi:hypothetical protein
MILLYPWLGAALLAAFVAVGVVTWRRARAAGVSGGGTRLANTGRAAALESFRRAVLRHRRITAWAALFALIAAFGTALMAARPADAKTLSPELRNRDVVLCLDVSGSMYPVDAAILRQFRQIVEEFDGERVAMSWFNSSSVTLFPLTDDYEFIDETLEPIQKQFDTVANIEDEDDYWSIPEEYFPDSSGTLLGEGSSLPGDGLVSCLQLFDRQNEDRPRSIIFATDNMVEGYPIFELDEAVELAIQAEVRVYSLCPDPGSISGFSLFGGQEYWAADAAEELKEETESTGGAYFEASDSRSVRRIVDDILAQEASLLDATPERVIHDRPFWGLACLALGLGGILVTGGWSSERRGRRVELARRGGIVALLALAMWNPSVGTETFKQMAVDADVFVLVDTSPSIAAEDWEGDHTRLEGVKADLAALAAHHVGAHISIITFDSEATTVLPLSTDAGAVTSAADTLAPITTWYASGSSIDSALDSLVAALERSREQHPERARLVYYMGDGEQTTDEPVRSFESAAELVDGGAVLGYGTPEGGPMLEYEPDWLSDDEGFGTGYEPEPEYIEAPDGSVGISKIDEDALEQIAEELGVPYSSRSADSPVVDALWQGELPERTLETETDMARPMIAWLALAASPLVAWELALLLRRFRKANHAARLVGPRAGRSGGGAATRAGRTRSGYGFAGAGAPGWRGGPGGRGWPGWAGGVFGGRGGNRAGGRAGPGAPGGGFDNPAGGGLGGGAGGGPGVPTGGVPGAPGGGGGLAAPWPPGTVRQPPPGWDVGTWR